MFPLKRNKGNINFLSIECLLCHANGICFMHPRAAKNWLYSRRLLTKNTLPLCSLAMTPPLLLKAPFLQIASPTQRVTQRLAKYKLFSIYTRKPFPLIHGTADADCLQTATFLNCCLQSCLPCKRRKLASSQPLCFLGLFVCVFPLRVEPR